MGQRIMPPRSECAGDTFYIRCGFCDYEATKRKAHNADLTPAETAVMHERFARHVRSKHVAVRAALSGETEA
jgi:hypothetical protein